MALFKIYRGKETNLPSTRTDGYAYFCTDTCNFYIDWSDGTGAINRVQINANCANYIRFEEDGIYTQIDAGTLAAHLSDINNPHNVTAEQTGAVPVTRKINGKLLKDDINLTAEDVGLTTDSTLSIQGSAADAKAAGDVIGQLFSVKAETATYKGILLTDSWSDSAPYTQQITIDGVLQTDYPFVDIDLSNVNNAIDALDAWKLVGRVSVSENDTIVAYCYEKAPTVDLPIICKVVR